LETLNSFLKTAIFLTIVLFLFSCQKDNKINGNNSLILEGVFQKDDEFQLFYSRNFFKEYDEKQSVKKEIRGSNSVQKIKFDIPNGFSPHRIRLDLGNNIAQNKIIIKEVRLLMFGKNTHIYKYNFEKFFFCNEYAKFKKRTGEIELNPISGSYDPYFISKNLLLETNSPH
jgi:hypothetical protein